MTRRGVLAVLAAVVALTGCAADWDGSRRLATDECREAAGLFTGQAGPALVDLVPDDLRADADRVVRPVDDTVGSADPVGDLEALERLQAWAAETCGPGVTGGPVSLPAPDATALPPAEELVVVEYVPQGVDVPVVAVTGAQSLEHALLLCAEAVAAAPGSEIGVKDVDGFLLAVAVPGEECALNPLLLE